MTEDIVAEFADALVVAVDDSPPARKALRWAAQLAARLDEPLHVVTVWNLVTHQMLAHAPGEIPSEAAWEREALHALEALLAGELNDAGTVRSHAIHGNTAPVLQQISEVASHLVLGSRGRGAVAGMLLGSTSEELVRHGRCPVTVVRGD
jgi:nucleotide-binding universal stress UspA family protein